MEEKGKEEKAMLTTTPSQYPSSSTMLHRVPSKPDFVLYVYTLRVGCLFMLIDALYINCHFICYASLNVYYSLFFSIALASLS
jgi:hypothetical protein